MEMIELLVCFTHNLGDFVDQALGQDGRLILVDELLGRNLLVARSQVACFGVWLESCRLVGGHLLRGQRTNALAG